MLQKIKNKITGDPKVSDLLWAIKGFWGETRDKANERYFSEKTRHMIPDYIKNNTVRKLNIGSQDSPFPGWLNVDIYAGFENVAFLDATKKFPVDDETFDYIFSEHMIEHINYDQADFMIKECYRILKKGGKIRIVTPGLDRLISRRNDTDNETLKKYTKNLVQATYTTPVTPHIDYVINYITYNYGHKFIHSIYTLTQLLGSNGFKNMKSREVHESDDENFKNLEIHMSFVGEDLYKFESIVIEAEK